MTVFDHRNPVEQEGKSASFVILSGCSGGGKSTVLAELAARGHAVVEEPGRRIITEEIASGGTALPWTNMVAFLRRAIDMALADRAAAETNRGWTFFDRSLVDAASALESLTSEPALRPLSTAHRYHGLVFVTPPWPEIYVTDAERQHGFDEAVAEYDRLTQTFPSLGYEVVPLPKTAPAARADYVVASLEAFNAAVR